MRGSHRGVRLGLSIALAASLLTACSGDGDGGDGDGGTEPLDLDGRTFVAEVAHGRLLVTGTNVTLSFEDGRVSAQAGCNTMNGEATWTDGTLTVPGPLAMTRMACERGLEAQDQWLSELLTSSPAISLDGETLTVGNDQRGLTLTESD